MCVCVRHNVQDTTFLTFASLSCDIFWAAGQYGASRRSGGGGATFACAVRRRSEEMKRQKEGTTSYGFVA